jgi:anti-sigma-K factor RskA
MTDTQDHSGEPHPPEDEQLAAEVALGVLAEPMRAEAARRAQRDPAFAALVSAWEERLAPWAAEIAEVPPPPRVWNAIATQLGTPAATRRGLWHSLAFWRGLTLASAALAAACIGALIYLGTAKPAAPLIAAIDGGGQHHFVATVDLRRGTVAVVPAAFAADPTRVPELWLIPAGGKPMALGLLRADRTVVITVPPALRSDAKANAVLAVSLEPPGGSPTGQPTGPVIATGKLTSL